VVLVVELAQLVFYNTVTYRVLFHSDASAKNLLAGEILRTRQLFPADWYSPDSVWVLANQLYVVLLYPFFNVNGFGLHSAAGVASAVVLCAVVWYFLASLRFLVVTRLLAVTILLTAFSSYMSENLFGQAAYGFVVMLTLLNLAVLFSAVEHATGGRRVFVAYCLSFGLLLFLTVMGGLRWLLSLTAPLLITSLICLLCLRLDKAHLRALLWLSLVIVLASGVGYAVTISLDNTHLLIANKASSGFADTAKIGSNAGLILTGSLYLFGALPTPGAPFTGIGGFRVMYSFFFACLLLVGAGLALRQAMATQRPIRLFFAIFSFINLLLTLYFVLFTNVLINLASSRYLVVPAILLLLAALQYVDSKWPITDNVRWTTAAVIVLMPLYLLSPFYMVAPAIKSIDTAGGRLNVALNTNQLERLANFLTSNGQSYCYATFWHADAVTVLASSAVRVRQIQLADGLPIPLHWLASLSWFRPESHQGSTCLILSKDEQSEVSQEKLARYLGQPDRVLQFENISIAVYPFNLAAKLPNWP
jgi:hypothetical protein